jgi:hypothetical protein
MSASGCNQFTCGCWRAARPGRRSPSGRRRAVARGEVWDEPARPRLCVGRIGEAVEHRRGGCRSAK